MATTTVLHGDGTTWTAAVRALGARTDNAGDAVTDLAADEDRLINHILTEGYLTDGAFAVSDGTSGMQVTIGSGIAKTDIYVVEGDDTGQHPYIVRMDDAEVTTTLDAGDADPRIDEIYLVVADAAHDGGSVTEGQLGYRKGDASSSPSAPGPDDSWDAWVKLATIEVAASASTVDAGGITDERSGAGLLPQLNGAQVGTIEMTARTTAPPGWVLCQGQGLSRVDYAALFAAIGTTYGSGNGTTTFNIPDLRGRVPIGSGTLSGDSYSLGDTGGSSTHTLTSAEMPSHVHSGPSHSHGSGTLSTSNTGSHDHTIKVQDSGSSHSHSTNLIEQVASDPIGTGTSTWYIGGATISDSGNHTHTISGSTASGGTGNTGSTGGGNAHENRPPYLALNFIIFAAV